jgi:endonuclease/exonuclease/phosphatase family metal-dependent hydrolase
MTTELRIMSFNIWRSGGRSLDRTIDAIRVSRPDVVGLQECNASAAEAIAGALGWDGVRDDQGHAILSRFPATSLGRTDDVWGGLGATIDLGERGRIHIFDAHLHYTDYGPYFLQDGRSTESVLDSELSIRMPGLEEILEMMTPALRSSEREPAFLVGDFNAPSHLDYVDVAWPESLACHDRGLVDSYRAVHPNNRRYPGPFRFDEPGITWTPAIEEEPRGVFDRIDFVYYADSSRLRVMSAVEVDARCGVDPWPSDHRAVLSTFAMG